MIAVSAQIRDAAHEEYGLPEAKITVCTNWISPAFRPAQPPERAAARHRLGLSQDMLVFGYLGRLSADKRGETMLQAFAEFLRHAKRETRLVVAGDGWMADNWRELARNLGIARRVHFVGWQDDPARIYHALNVFVLPSVSEGFPLGVMEAMACGVPGLVHPLGSTLDLVQDGRHGFIADMSQTESLAQTFGAIAEKDPGELAVMGRMASAHIAAHHSRQRRLPAVLAALDIHFAGELPPPLPRPLQFLPWDTEPRLSP